MRQYLASEMPDKNNQLTVSGKDFKYLSQVLRLQVGDLVWVRLSDQSLVKMEVIKLQAKQLIFKKAENQDSDENATESGVTANNIKNLDVQYWVFQFVPKSSKMDLVIRMSVECGVSRIIPVKGEFSEKHDSNNRQERYERLLKEARQQSGSPVDTKIENAMSLEEAVTLWKNECKDCQHTAFVLHEADIADKSLFFYLNGKADKIKKVALAIGPEGGMSDREVEYLKENGFNLIHFNTNVLRCETACLYGIAAIQSAISEYESWQK
ncbi:MAG: 16S rRNA (uracil(1498)-N(3))-methyltransferase [Treponemataceae bacterium]|nr:16S rRNA (uracil(1498)-N(3))-methyltransferase [Treponemataceae bacterium]